ncbi:MAG: DUF4177 domain-containing protein [Candidatus Hydrogenedentes bacterium]|nr:DUF4177 domain-containing protein [Candidatus Hydrogenedentota bacterium]
MQWEYTTIKVGAGGFYGGRVDAAELNLEMNRMGRQDWELVTAFTSNARLGQSRAVILLFKRPLE